MPKKQSKHGGVPFITGFTSMQQHIQDLFYRTGLLDFHLEFPPLLIYYSFGWYSKHTGFKSSSVLFCTCGSVWSITCCVLMNAQCVCLRCCGRSSHPYINSSIYSGSPRMLPTDTEKRAVNNKQKQHACRERGQGDDSVSASETKHDCGWKSKQARVCDTQQLSWGKPGVMSRWITNTCFIGEKYF